VQDIYFIIDSGNTRIKCAFYKKDKLIDYAFFSSVEKANFLDFSQKYAYKACLISSVLSEADNLILFKDVKKKLFLSQAEIPLEIIYENSSTLGSDRIANAVAAKFKSKSNTLIIDVGTCIKFDFIDKDGKYLGGSISPGISLRYKSLNDYTGNLPLLTTNIKKDLIGNDTNSCIESGVLNGIQGEINHFIDYYSNLFQDLTIFVTGGDYLYFDYSSKNGIFADEKLTLFGLLQILKANV
jgi:type III pantothenate kinase